MIDFSQVQDGPDKAEMAKAQKRVEEMCKRYNDLLRQRKQLEADLKEMNKQIREYEMEHLPNVLENFGLVELTLKDGTKIAVTEEVYAHISKRNEAAALQWLRDNDYGDLVKNEVRVSFGRGEDAKAERLKSLLERQGYNDFSQRETVHAQTLKKFVRDAVESGEKIPYDLFGVQIVKKAEVK